MKKFLAVLACAIFSVAIVAVLTLFSDEGFILDLKGKSNVSVLDQQIIAYSDTEREYYKIYDGGQLVGIVTDYEGLEADIAAYYEQYYEADYPDTYMTFCGDFYVSKETAYYEVEDIDDEIFAYLIEADALGIVTNVIDFATDEGVYATIYVNDIDDYNNAWTAFLNNFISEEERTTLVNETLTEMTSVGDRAVGYRIEQSVSTHRGVAPISEIMTTQEEVYFYLCYGDNEDIEYYTVQEGDTLQGVGYLYGDMSPEQIMMLNPDLIFSTDQILEPGMVLNVTYFTSPINVIVTMESLRLETVYADQAIVQYDSTLFEGTTEVIQEEADGEAYVLYEETWINGVLMSGREVSESIITQPVQAIIAVGTQERPSTGTGTFRWPVDNVRLTCGWACYVGHQATDLVNRYERYGYIYAADNGTVVEKSYDSISGYYIVIDHNNGFQTYYGHMLEASSLEVGDTVMKGDVIGTLGSTGYTTGVHVHFEIRVDGVKVDPCIYMNCEAIS